MEGTINTRDLGGYPTTDGHHVRYGRLIRTDNLSHITQKDTLYFQNVLKARFDVDFRSLNEIAGKEDKPIPGCEKVLCPVVEDRVDNRTSHPHEEFIVDRPNVKNLIEFIFRIAPDGDVTYAMENSYRAFVGEPFGYQHYARFLQLALANKEGSILFHCADGKDRAGVGAFLLLSALGVSREDCLKDYLRTNEYTGKKAESREAYLRNDCHITNEKVIQSVKMLAGVRLNWISAALSEIDNRYGGMDSYVANQLKLSANDLKLLRDNYLE
jgi:protein-tyrosine phosphatase